MRRDKAIRKKENNKEKKTKKTKAGRKKIVLTIIIAIVAILIITLIIRAVKNSLKEDEPVSEESSELTLLDTNLEEYVKETTSGIKINVSTALNQNKKVDGLDVTNIQLTSQNGVTTLLADVTNNTAESTSLKNVIITFLNEDGDELISVDGIIMGLEVGKSTKLNVSLSSNYVSAYDFTVTSK